MHKSVRNRPGNVNPSGYANGSFVGDLNVCRVVRGKPPAVYSTADQAAPTTPTPKTMNHPCPLVLTTTPPQPARYKELGKVISEIRSQSRPCYRRRPGRLAVRHGSVAKALANSCGSNLSAVMELQVARQNIHTSLARMRAIYGEQLFDEWAILAAGAKQRGILAYDGPRIEAFSATFQADIAPLRDQLTGNALTDGDFAFAPDAYGTRHDAVMRTGPGSYLILNNTIKSMREIRANPLWLKAQAVFVELSEKFQADPLGPARN